MGRQIAMAMLVTLCAPGPAFADPLKLISGAVICQSLDGLERWIDAVEEDNAADRSALLESGQCRYNFRAQVVEASPRMFFKRTKIVLDGTVWYTAKENLRVPAPDNQPTHIMP